MQRSNCVAIIVTYNGEKWIKSCIKSVQLSDVPIDIQVIDNCSTDNTIAIVKSFEGIIISELKENIGFGKANNIGLKRAIQKKYEYIFLINQDVYVDQETIKNLIMVSSENNNYGILSPIHLSGNGQKFDYQFAKYVSVIHNCNLLEKLVLNRQSVEIANTDFVNAAFWLITKKCLKTIGGFDPIIRHYSEDDNYIKRVRYHHFEIGIVPNCFIRHDRDENSSYFSSNKHEHNLLLQSTLDISEDFRTNIIGVFRHIFVKGIKSLVMLRVRTYAWYVAEFFFFVRNYKRIMNHRRLYKKKTPIFLVNKDN